MESLAGTFEKKQNGVPLPKRHSGEEDYHSVYYVKTLERNFLGLFSSMFVIFKEKMFCLFESPSFSEVPLPACSLFPSERNWVWVGIIQFHSSPFTTHMKAQKAPQSDHITSFCLILVVWLDGVSSCFRCNWQHCHFNLWKGRGVFYTLLYWFLSKLHDPLK